MTIFQKILRLLTPADPKRTEAKAERAERTEKAIERYDALLNAQRQRAPRPPTLAGALSRKTLSRESVSRRTFGSLASASGQGKRLPANAIFA